MIGKQVQDAEWKF